MNEELHQWEAIVTLKARHPDYVKVDPFKVTITWKEDIWDNNDGSKNVPTAQNVVDNWNNDDTIFEAIHSTQPKDLGVTELPKESK